MITVFANNEEIETNRVEFSDGALTYKLDTLPESPTSISINVHPSTPVAIIREEVGLVVSCIQQFYKSSTLKGLPFPVELNLPYTGYGRADRVFEKGNPTAPLYTFLDYLRELSFTKINICDLHNPSVLEDWELNNDNVFNNKPQLQCYKQSLPHDFIEEYDLVVAPDKGAVLKANTIAEHLEVDICYAGKRRNITTGAIEATTLPEDVDFTGKKVLIPDDLIDGGFTFIKLAELLKERGAKEVHLYVTHLIASKGLKCLTPMIDKIYFYHTVGHYVNDTDVLNFNNGII